MANILDNPAHRANLGRNGFDMSQRHPFTSSVGHLLPVYYDLLSPGDKIKIGANLFTRTQPLNSSALVRLTEHIEYFFVPMDQIYTLFGSMFYGISDVNSTAFTSNTVKSSEITMPIFGVKGIRDWMVNNWVKTPVGEGYPKTLDLDMQGQPLMYGALRLSELLGYGYTYFSTTDNDLNKSLPIYLACAYQKIFNDYYRLDDWTSPDRYSYNLDYFDLNNSSSQSDALRACSAFRLRYRPWKKDYFTNVFRNPYFSLSNQSSIERLNDGATEGTNSLLHLPVGLNSLDSQFISQNDDSSGTNENTIPKLVQPGPQSHTLSVTDLRYLYATDKLLRITQFAGKHYNAQTLAHFGVKVPEGVSGEVYYLGGQSQPLIINTIEATATTESESNPDGSVLGQIGAKGYSTTDGKKEFSFVAPCHGILMAIYSAVPDADYSDERLDYLNTLVYSNDFYKPEFDNLGMEILPKYELSLLPTLSTTEVFGCGWRYRYSGLKSKPDIVSGAFKYTLRDWVSFRNDVKYVGTDEVFDFNKYVFGTEAYFYIDPSYLDNIFALGFTPSDSELVFDPEKTYNNTIIDRSTVYKRDPLLHDLYIKCYKTSVMSTYGLPNL